MDAYYCKTSKEACALVESLLPKGCTVSSGGSVTLKEDPEGGARHLTAAKPHPRAQPPMRGGLSTGGRFTTYRRKVSLHSSFKNIWYIARLSECNIIALYLKRKTLS